MPCLGIVGGCQPLGMGAGIAVRRGVAPTDLLHGVPRFLPVRRVYAHLLLVLLLRDRVLVDRQRADEDPVKLLVRFVVVAGAHLEPATGNRHHLDPARRCQGLRSILAGRGGHAATTQ